MMRMRMRMMMVMTLTMTMVMVMMVMMDDGLPYVVVANIGDLPAWTVQSKDDCTIEPAHACPDHGRS
jgi:hypothetical protein